MAMAGRNDLQVDKALIWITRLPYENEARTSPAFSLLGSEWCFRFVYRDVDGIYHNITLHQMSDGKILKEVQDLKKTFDCKTYIAGTQDGDEGDEIAVQRCTVNRAREDVWFLGNEKDEIFITLPCLYDCPDIKIVCKFYGHLPSTFQLHIETENPTTKNVHDASEVPTDLESLSSDFSHLLEKEVFPDARLECEGRTFQVHRSVLAARSKVFSVMFQIDMLESKTGTVEVPDMDVGGLERLLRYVYTGKPEDISESTAAELYEAADKYDVHSLKTACTNWIARNLNVENCVRYLVFADSHSDRDLRAAVISFIVENPTVLKSEAWITFSKIPSKLANRVFQAYIASTVQ